MASIEELLRLSLIELKSIYLDGRKPVPQGLLEALENDPRQGARDVAAKIRARYYANRSEGQRLRHLLRYESEIWAHGFELIAGVDEAGMAPLAGPVVACAVILPRNYHLRQLDDSKRLDETTRQGLALQIKSDAVAWSAGIAEVEEIDRLNIYHAGLLAMRRAIEGLSLKPGFVLVDARVIPECTIAQRSIIRGDQLSASIAAASILAKTTRDAMMIELDRNFPGYGLAGHKGYPTPEHFRALRELGPTSIHRRSFRPVQLLKW